MRCLQIEEQLFFSFIYNLYSFYVMSSYIIIFAQKKRNNLLFLELQSFLKNL